MSFLRFTPFFRLKTLFVIVLALQLSACLDGGSAGSKTFEFVPGSSNTDKITGAVDDNGLSLSWIAPSQREDGSPIALSEIAGYRIYYGTEQGVYPNRIDINDGSADQAVIPDLPPAEYYVVVTTIDVDGRESSYSQPVVVTI